MNFADLIDRWPSREALATATGQSTDVVHKWRQRRRIPAEHWPRMLAEAPKYGVRLDVEELLAAQKRAGRAA